MNRWEINLNSHSIVASNSWHTCSYTFEGGEEEPVGLGQVEVPLPVAHGGEEEAVGPGGVVRQGAVRDDVPAGDPRSVEAGPGAEGVLRVRDLVPPVVAVVVVVPVVPAVFQVVL